MPHSGTGASKIRFGRALVDPNLQQLRLDGVTVPLPHRTFLVLVALIEANGKCVSKEDLLRTVWAEEFVDESNLTHAIARLRKVLDTGSDGESYIATVPRVGYRLAVALQPEVDTPRLSTGPIFWRRITPWAAGAIVVISLGAIWIAGRTPSAIGTARNGGTPDSNTPRVRPLTSLVGGEYEPAFSPDGQKIAFSWNGESESNYDIYVMPVAGGPPERLTAHPAGEGSPVWSPDGRRLAFLRYSAKAGEAGVYVLDLANKQTRQLVRSTPLSNIHDRHLDWSPNGRMLALADRDAADRPFALDLVDAATGARRRLTAPSGSSLGDTGPAFSPDGQTVAFRRGKSEAVRDLWIVAVQGGEPRQVTHDQRNSTAHAWLPDGQSLIFASNRRGTVGLWRISQKGGEPEGPLAGDVDAYYLAVDRTTGRIAFSQLVQDSDVWMMNLQRPAEHRKLISTTRREASAQFSPDGLSIAYRSDRAGSDEIWLWEQGGAHERQLTSFGGPLTGSPRWSPDGAEVVFDSRPAGQSDVFVVARGGGAPRQLTSDSADDVLPCFALDGQWVFFASNRTGSWQVWRVGVGGETKGPATQVTSEGGFAPQVSLDGRQLFFAKGHSVPGIWSMPIGGGSEKLVIAQTRQGTWGVWAPVKEGIVHFSPAGSDWAVNLFSLTARSQTMIAPIGGKPSLWDSGFSVQGHRLIYTRMERDGSDLLLLESPYGIR